jgi:hypothetical protein
MSTYTVSRKTWYRGKTDEDSSLLRPDGQRCCIGFVAEQCGVSDAGAMNTLTARELPSRSLEKMPEWMWVNKLSPGSDIDKCYALNDSAVIKDSERKQRLRAAPRSQANDLRYTNG